MPLAWIAQILFFGSYFVAWLVGAFNTLTSVSSGAHTAIVVSALAALAIAILLLVDNRTVIVRHG